MSLEAVGDVRSEFERLARRFESELVRYAHERTRSLEDARDIVQGSLLKAWLAFRDGSRPENARAWLYRITHNEAANLARQGESAEQSLLL